MTKVGIIAYGITPFTKDDKKIESVLLKSAKNLFENNPEIDRNDIDAVLVSTNNNSKYLSPIFIRNDWNSTKNRSFHRKSL